MTKIVVSTLRSRHQLPNNYSIAAGCREPAAHMLQLRASRYKYTKRPLHCQDFHPPFICLICLICCESSFLNR